MYGWIIEADIVRLRRAINETTSAEERAQLRSLLEIKNRQLAATKQVAMT